MDKNKKFNINLNFCVASQFGRVPYATLVVQAAGNISHATVTLSPWASSLSVLCLHRFQKDEHTNMLGENESIINVVLPVHTAYHFVFNINYIPIHCSVETNQEQPHLTNRKQNFHSEIRTVVSVYTT